MRYKYYYCQLYNPKLKDVLEKYQIHYQIIEETRITPSFIRFSIFSASNNATEIVKEIATISRWEPIIYAEYTASEIANAELLWILPIKQCVDILNTEEAYISTCEHTDFVGMRRANHRQQRDLFMVGKEPTVGKRTAFWANDTGFQAVFTDYRVCELVKENSLSGIEFKNVRLKNGTYSSKLFQLTAKQVIDRKFIGTGYGEKILRCKYCGKEQYSINPSYQLHLDFSQIDPQCDMYMTECMFGDGIAEPLYLISQRFYQLLKQAKLSGGLNVFPVASIEESFCKPF